MDKLGEAWISRIHASDKYFKDWEKRFKCKTMFDYYEGKQRPEPYTDQYILNLIYATVEIKLPMLLFGTPEFHITPTTQTANFNPEGAYQKALLATDVVNSIVQNPNTDFVDNTSQVILDSLFYFGMVEVGYDADWINNPNAGKPAYAGDYDNNAENPESIVRQPDKLPENEWLYLKRIEPWRVRFGTNNAFQLKKLPWIAYYEYFRKEDILSSTNFKNKERFKEAIGTYGNLSQSTSSQYPGEFVGENEDSPEIGDLVKVWKIFDLRKKLKYNVVEIGNVVIYEKPFKRLPLIGLKFSNRLKGWLPIPPVSQWKDPQDEQNQAKQQISTHRKRSKIVLQVNQQGITPEEEDKVISGPDMVVVHTQGTSVLNPVQMGTLDPSVGASLEFSKSDMDIVTGVSQQQRLQKTGGTATEITAIMQRTQIRESNEQNKIAVFLNEIAAEILHQAIEKFTLPLWIKLTQDTAAFGQEIQATEQAYKAIMVDELEGIGYQFNVILESISPIVSAKEEEKFLKFLALLNQYPMISLNPDLIRELAYRVGYRNEKVILQMQRAALLQMLGQVSQGMQQTGGLGGRPVTTNQAQQTAEQAMPNSQAEIENQLQSQGVPQ